MRSAFASLVAAASLVASSTAFAAAPASAPAGSTGLCKDGTYTTHDTKKGACSGHKGVKEWFEATAAAAPTAKSTAAAAPAKTAAPAAAAAAAPAAAPAPAAAKTAPVSTKTAAATTSNAAPAPGGGAGQVWVNSSSKVYHCPGTKYYGKTKHGEYMSESAAKAAGDHPDHGKACS